MGVSGRASPERAGVSTSRNSNAGLTAGCADADARTVVDGHGHVLVRQRLPVRHDVVRGTQDQQDRSPGLSFRRSIAMAHSSTSADRMRWRTSLVVAALASQMGVGASAPPRTATTVRGRRTPAGGTAPTSPRMATSRFTAWGQRVATSGRPGDRLPVRGLEHLHTHFPRENPRDQLSGAKARRGRGREPSSRPPFR